MKKIIYIFWLIFIVACKDNSSLFPNSNIVENENNYLSEKLNLEDNKISKKELKNKEFLEDNIPSIKSYTTTRKESNNLSEKGESLKQIKTDIISDLGYKILYTDINYPLISTKKNEMGIDKINIDCEKFIKNIEKNYIKENLTEIIKKCNEEGCYDICYLYIRGKILYKDDEKINVGIDVSINTGSPYSYDLFYSKIYDLNNGENLILEDLVVNSNEILENAKKGFRNRIGKDFDWVFSNSFDINKAQYYLNENGIVFCFDESEVPNVIYRLEYTVPKENIIFR